MPHHAEGVRCQGVESFCWNMHPDPEPIEWYRAQPDKYVVEENHIGVFIEIRCDDVSFREPDPRFNIPLCRRHFLMYADKWRDDNEQAGLCRCGNEPAEGRKSCERCLQRKAVDSKKAYKKQKEAKQAEARREQDKQDAKESSERLRAATNDELFELAVSGHGTPTRLIRDGLCLVSWDGWRGSRPMQTGTVNDHIKKHPSRAGLRARIEKERQARGFTPWGPTSKAKVAEAIS